jgi:hypothetical protein
MGKPTTSCRGKLEISKCKFSQITWAYDSNGTAIIETPNSTTTIAIQGSETKEAHHINEITTAESYKLLGINMALDGNSTNQIQQFEEKCH